MPHARRVARGAGHEALSRRLQRTRLAVDLDPADAEKNIALFLRYQTTHERAFHKCWNDLLKLRAEKRRSEIGFESQKQKQAEEQRRADKHQMKKSLHSLDLLLAEARVTNQLMLSAGNHPAGEPRSAEAKSLLHKMMGKLDAVSREAC